MSGAPSVRLEGVDELAFAAEVLNAATMYEGAPFAAHEPLAGCNGFTTLPACMETGLGPEEFDCTGLVLRAIADVVGVNPSEMNPRYRHLRQIAALANTVVLSDTDEVPEGFGVVRVGRVDMRSAMPVPRHVGLYTAREHRDGIWHATSQSTKGVRFDYFARTTSHDTTKILSPLKLAERLVV